MSHWQPYEPSSAQPWDVRRVVHLHRRAVFGATYAEIQRDLREPPQAAVSRVLTGRCRQYGVPENFDQLANLIGESAVQSQNPDRLKAWWIYRVLFSPDPLRERLTLMWHNHFATSNSKVNDLLLMKQQNDTLRRHGRASFGELLQAMLNDSALLVWLDADANRSGRPNENLARELMELFTLGIGHYTETDVKELARALTGLSVRQGQSAFNAEHHDAGEKQIFGQTAPADPERAANLLLTHPATALRLAWRLTTEFFADNVVPDEAVEDLASLLRSNNLHIGVAVETILRSNLFFSDANLQSRVCDPLTFQISVLRAFGVDQMRPSTLELARWLTQMGWDLFYPPNVGGWESGRAWLNARTVIARMNFVSALCHGDLTANSKGAIQPLDLLGFIEQTAPRKSIREFACLVLLGVPATTDSRIAEKTARITELSEFMLQPAVHLH